MSRSTSVCVSEKILALVCVRLLLCQRRPCQNAALPDLSLLRLPWVLLPLPAVLAFPRLEMITFTLAAQCSWVLTGLQHTHGPT